MSDVVSDAATSALIYALLLALPISALAARRLPLSMTMRYVVAWVVIFAAGVALVMLYQRIAR